MGKVIKGIAITLMVLGILGGAIMTIKGASQYNEDKEYIEYATVNGGSRYSRLEEAGNNAYAGKTLMTYGIASVIGSVVACLPLFWFGCLFVKVDDIQSKVYENNREIEELKKQIGE